MLIMALIRNGHNRIYEYGVSKLNSAQEELEAHKSEQLLNRAYSNRVAKSSNEDWKKFVGEMQKKQKADTPAPPKKKMTKEDHMAVIRRLKGIK